MPTLRSTRGVERPLRSSVPQPKLPTPGSVVNGVVAAVDAWHSQDVLMPTWNAVRARNSGALRSGQPTDIPRMPLNRDGPITRRSCFEGIEHGLGKRRKPALSDATATRSRYDTLDLVLEVALAHRCLRPRRLRPHPGADGYRWLVRPSREAPSAHHRRSGILVVDR
jgi:hypothetical protein